ncbi:MAG TPA: hypothetical protein DIW81_17105, partial [Planctomycetaceae bacterium]|nr:hypothetical protein [Planctomycetaceae bacterium]
GKLDRRITIEKPIKEADASGQKITSWQQHCRTWAAIMPLTGSEQLKDNRQVSEDVRWIITVRYNTLNSQVAADMRIQHAGRTLSIQSAIDVDDRHEQIEITALERK